MTAYLPSITSVCGATVSSFCLCCMAFSASHCSLQANYSTFPKPFFSLSLLVHLSPSFLSSWMAEWTRPPLEWWLALSTTSWETGTTECPLAPSMSSRLCVCVTVCVCDCLSTCVCVHYIRLTATGDCLWIVLLKCQNLEDWREKWK